MIFFKDNNSSQQTAKLGSLKLAPSLDIYNTLEKDYEQMEVMILGIYPKFRDIIDSIGALENKLNKILG